MSGSAARPNRRPERALRGRLLRAAQLLFAAALLAYLLGSGQLEPRALSEVARRWPWWLAANLAYLMSLTGLTLRWHLLLHQQQIPLRLRDTASLTLIGLCVSQVTPGATGGDIAKALALVAGRRDRRSAALCSIAVDRGLGLFTLAASAGLLALTDLSAVLTQPLLALFAGAAAAGALLALLALLAIWTLPVQRWPGVRHGLAWLGRRAWGAETIAALALYAREPLRLAAPLAASLLVSLGMLLAHLCLARALFGSDFDARALLAAVPLLLLAAGVPITPFGNAGVLEGLYAEVLGYAGIGQGALLGLLLRSVLWAWALVGAAVLLLRGAGTPAPALEPQLEAQEGA